MRRTATPDQQSPGRAIPPSQRTFPQYWQSLELRQVAEVVLAQGQAVAPELMPSQLQCCLAVRQKDQQRQGRKTMTAQAQVPAQEAVLAQRQAQAVHPNQIA